ncbi:MAG TPA: NAD-dependent epimerase/dehydratase family protein [Chthonomonadaceae bacterium]|nr:NAD-dependent epimerase/dehydratase family protein [Chthonomonadaceae bacterium]
MPQREEMKAPANEEELEERLSCPTVGVTETLARLDGDVMVLGAGGKMGPTLARMVRRGFEAAGKKQRVLAVARFSDPAVAARLQAQGVETGRCDLLDRQAVQQLPDVPNVIFMAGYKFGSSADPERTWAMNVLVPAFVAERFAGARIVAFSSGCVYPYTPVRQGGSRETDPLDPVGEYATTCVGRERVFTYFSQQNGTPLVLFRLNYAVDLRYGVLTDVAQKVMSGTPIDLTMGYANVIWQGDANAWAIQCLQQTANPPFILNATGPEIVSIRALAERFGEILGRAPVFTGEESGTALLSNASKAHALFGAPQVSLNRLTQWTAAWLTQGGRTLGKPTHFEVRDGNY